MNHRRWLMQACNLALALSLLAWPSSALAPPTVSAAVPAFDSAGAAAGAQSPFPLPGLAARGQDTVTNPSDPSAAPQRVAAQACVAPEVLDVTGPDTVLSGSTNTFTAAVLTVGASLPISYTWEYPPDLATPVVQVVNSTQTTLDLLSVTTGTRPITVTAENCGGRVTTVGEVGVKEAPLPDLVVTDVWSVDAEVHFQIENVGEGVAPSGYEVRMELDGAWVGLPVQVTQDLEPGERLEDVFLARWRCSGEDDIIRVVADAGDVIAEEDEGNNDHQETWQCDVTAPQITSGPSATVLAGPSVLIEWETDEDSDSEVHYGQTAGEAYQSTAYDATMTQAHAVSLPGLSPGVYHYEVASADISGNEVKSGEFFFEILPDAATPQIVQLEFGRKATVNPIYAISATVENWLGAERVDFYVDGDLFGTDYSGVPIPLGDTFEYHFDLNPVVQWTERADFFQEHEVEVVVVDYQDNTADLSTELVPIFEPLPVDLQILSPQTNDAIGYTQQPHLPDPTDVDIQVQAMAYKWSCGEVTNFATQEVTFACWAVAETVSSLHLYVLFEGTELRYTDSYTPGPDDPFQYNFTWPAGGEWAGEYLIRVVAEASDGSEYQKEVWVEAVYGHPSLELTRQVSFEPGQTYATVRLTLTNSIGFAPSTVYVESLTDWLQELQPVQQETSGYSLLSSYDHTTRVNQVDVLFGTLNLATQTRPPLALAPGSQVVIEYLAVPILYPDPPSNLLIGNSHVVVKYAYDVGTTPFYTSFLRQRDLTDLEIQDLTRAGDYILATNPGQLQQLPNNSRVDDLLSAMAELAALEHGVLGFLANYSDGSWSLNWGTGYLKQRLIEGGYWATALNLYTYPSPYPYLLIVGEEEVVPARTEEDLLIQRDDPEWIENEYWVVEHSDQPYVMVPGSSVYGETPRFRVGRIVGNTPGEMLKSLEASIDIARGAGGLGFDRSHAFLLSGHGSYQDDFRSVTAQLEQDLKDQLVTVTTVHASDSWQVGDFAFAFDDEDQLTCGDVDGDGYDEILIGDASADRIHIVRPNGTTLDWFHPVDEVGADLPFNSGDRLAAGDVWGDAKAEIVFMDWSSDKAYVYDGSGALQAGPIDIAGLDVAEIAIGDVDNDAQSEIVLGATDCGAGAGCIRGVDASGAVLYQVEHDFDYADDLAVGSVIAGPQAAGDEIIVADYDQDRLYLYGPTSGSTPLYEQDWTVEYTSDRLAVGSVSQGMFETIIAGQLYDTDLPLWLWNANDGELERTDRWIWAENLSVGFGLAVGNVQGDQFHEVVLGDPVNDEIRIFDGFPEDRVKSAVQESGGLVDHDVLFYRGHGAPGNWGAGLEETDPLIGFGATAPVAVVFACSTGNYEGDSDDGIAEHVATAGSPAYIGATQVSIHDQNNAATERYFELWDESSSAGDAFFRLESETWLSAMASIYAEERDYWLFDLYEYNYYGDPKYGALAGATGPGSGPAGVQATPSTLYVDVPAYTVTEADGFDRVEIPGGGMLSREGQPMVPYWPVTIEYAPGEMVQAVSLVSRSEPTVEDDLNLPYPILAHDSAGTSGSGAAALAASDGDGEDWVPDRNVPFDWTTWDNPDGTSTLLINVYPAFYNQDRAVLEFHQHFTFAVETTSSPVLVQALEVDQPTYPAWGDVGFSLWLGNHSARQDVLVSATVRRALSGELVQGLPLRNLQELGVRGFYRMSWDSSGAPAGRYFLDVELRDLAGKLLDQAAVQFELGETSAEVTSLSASPTPFLPGQAIDLSMTLRNTGSEAISGTAVMRVQTCEDGTVAATFTHAVENLTPEGTISFGDVWDTSGAEGCCYTVLGYLSFDSKTTEMATVTVERVGAQGVLELTKTDQRDPLPATWWARYEIGIHNTGTGPSGAVWLTDTIPSGMYFVPTEENEGWQYQNGQVTRELSNLGPGEHVSLSLVLGTRNAARGTFTNTVEAEWACFRVAETETTTIIAPSPPPVCPDLYEPNDALSEAWPYLSGPIESYICCSQPADEDFYRVTLAEGEEIDARLSDLPSNYELCLYGPLGTLLDCSTNPTTTVEHITHVAEQDGEYYVHVYGYEGKACDSAVPYTLEVNIRSAAITETPTPTATATATPTATPTATEVPPPVYWAYLPLVIKQGP